MILIRMTDFTSIELVLMLYGGFGGWLGISFAVYLNHIRHERASPTTILGVFALGWSLLMSTLLLSAPLPEQWLYALLFVTYTFVILAEIVLTAADARPKLLRDLHHWAFEKPHFVNMNRVCDDTDANMKD